MVPTSPVTGVVIKWLMIYAWNLVTLRISAIEIKSELVANLNWIYQNYMGWSNCWDLFSILFHKAYYDAFR